MLRSSSANAATKVKKLALACWGVRPGRLAGEDTRSGPTIG
jgi:hypothetical protein